jgi:hypothetical protein
MSISDLTRSKKVRLELVNDNPKPLFCQDTSAIFSKFTDLVKIKPELVKGEIYWLE